MTQPSKTARQLSVFRWVERVLVGLVLLGGIHVVPIFLSIPNKAKEPLARSMLAQMNQEQQQHYAQNATFLDTSRNLGSYTAAIASRKPLYRFSTRRMDDRVFSYAVPIQEYEFGEYLIFPWNRYMGLKRYVGVVGVSDRKTRATRSVICYIRSLDTEIVLTEVYGALACRSPFQSSSDNSLSR